MPDLVVRGGSIVTPDGVLRADLAVEDGRFSGLAEELPGCACEIDARGLTVFPGLIDVHVHFNEPGRTDWEGVATGSRALAAGGGTMFFDMPLNSSPCTLDGASYDCKLAALEKSSVTDFALWGGLVPANLQSLDELANRGVIGFKAFMCDSGLPEFPRADDLTLYEGMRSAARLGLPVAVHAESEELTHELSARIRASGRCAIKDYLESRPVLAEVEAIQRATLIAEETGARLHIVHISSGRGVVKAAEARARGVDVSIETCPHYLYFTAEDLERIGAVAKCAPPLRSAADREDLWTRLREGDVDIVASDHSPASPELKTDPDFFRVWGGIAGVQSTLAVLIDSGLPPVQIARLIAENPARRFGLRYKGKIAPGYHADFCLVEMDAVFTLRSEDLFYRHKVSPYTGSSFRGRVLRTVSKGKTIYG